MMPATKQPDNSILNAALEYLDMGFSVIPVKRKDKKPYIQWEEFQKRLPTEEEVISWWEKWPEANVAIICGKLSGIYIVDADGPAGIEWMKRNLPRSSVYSETFRGYHAVYLIPPNSVIGNKVRLAPEVDIRGEGGYFVAPPSIHASGHQYKWHFRTAADIQHHLK